MPAPPTRDGKEWLAEEAESDRKESQARARLAADVATAFEKTLKSFRQFGVRHKTSQGFVAEATRRIGAFTTELGELPLSVVGSDVLYDGESIYSDPELRQSYPFLLFRDGVQRVIFEPGVAPEEVQTFCQLLRDQSVQGSQVAMEDDLVTLLWDADLHHLRYVVSEGFKQEDVDDEREAERQELIGQIKSEALQPRFSAELSARFVRPPKERDLERTREDLETAKAWERGNQILADEKARAALASEVDSDDVLLRKFLEIVFAEILRHQDRKTRADLVGLVRDYTIEATRRDRLAEAIGVLKALGDLAHLAGADGQRVAQEILGTIATTEILAELMRQLEIADDQGTEQLLTFLALMPARESSRLVPLLSTVATISRRRAVCQLLADRLGDDLAAVGEQIRASDEALALDLVYLLRQAGSPRARVELLLALDHPSAEVRRAAFEAIRRTGARDATAVGAALLAVEDPDVELRRQALVTLPRQLDPDVARRLRAVISREVFDDWDYSDKRRAFLAYAAAAGKKAARELLEVLAMRGLFSSEALEDRRCSAAFALASLGDEGHLAALEAEQKRLLSGKRIKEACEAAIATLTFKRPIEDDRAAAAAWQPGTEVEVVATAHLPKPIWSETGNDPTPSRRDATGQRRPS